MTPEDQAQQEEAKAAAEDQRRAMLVALLQPAARDRRKLQSRDYRLIIFIHQSMLLRFYPGNHNRYVQNFTRSINASLN